MDRRRPSSLGRLLSFHGIVDFVNVVADRADTNLGYFRDALKCLLKTSYKKIDVRHDVRVAVEADTVFITTYHRDHILKSGRTQTIYAGLKRLHGFVDIEHFV